MPDPVPVRLRSRRDSHLLVMSLEPRSLLARSYQLVRSDIPRQKIEVDFELISGKLASKEEFAKLFGLATLQPATDFSAKYPYSLSDVGMNLGYPGWHGANLLIKRVYAKKGVDIKKSDNVYHCKVKIGRKSSAQMYSGAALQLLTWERDGEDYDLQLDG